MVHTPSTGFIIMFFHPLLRIISESYSALGIFAICTNAATYNVQRKAYNSIILYIFSPHVLSKTEYWNACKDIQGKCLHSCSQPHMNIAYDPEFSSYYNISLLAQFPMTLILIASSLSASSSLSFFHSLYPHVLSRTTRVHRAHGYMLL